MQVKIFGSPLMPRRLYQLNWVAPQINYRVHNHNIINLERAIKERVFFVKGESGFSRPPRPKSRSHFNRQLKDFASLLKPLLPRAAKMELQEFPGKYVGRKRTVYEQAVATILTGGFSKRSAEITAFVKAEKVNTTAKADPAPRVIQPRSPVFNVMVGCYIVPIEKRIYHAIDKLYGAQTVAKGLNAEERGRLIETKWRKHLHPVAVGLDASRFDQHVSITALEWEHQVYKWCYTDPAELSIVTTAVAQQRAWLYSRRYA